MIDAIRACLHATESIVGLYDRDDVLRYANPSYERRFLRGLATPAGFADVLRHGFANGFGVHIASGDLEGFLAGVLARRRSAPFRAFEVDTRDGEWLWMTETLIDDGWLLSIGSIITRLKDHERLLQRDRDHARIAADTDFLTGAFSRRRILELAESTLAACQRAQTPHSLVVLDLDHFKAVNDSFGHLAGDELLSQFTTVCTSGLRQHDLFGRFGGEEFLIVLPDTRESDAVRVVERVREGLPAANLANLPPHPYTFSAGVAEAEVAETLPSLLRRADAALYRAKANGRNRTEIG